MKSIIIKLSSLLLIFAFSLPSLACDPSKNFANNDASTETLSQQMMQNISDSYRDASF